MMQYARLAMVNKTLFLVPLLAVSVSSCRHADLAPAAQLRDAAGSDALFASQVLSAELHAPLASMFDAKDERHTYDVDIDTLDSDPPWSSDGVTFAVDGAAPMQAKVRVRGGVRRNCSFPPLKLKLAKGEAAGTMLAGFSAFKIGTHCEPDAEHRATPAREQALYRLYAVLSEMHFRARLMRLQYVDQNGAIAITEPALLLEEPADIAARFPGFEEYKPTWLEQAIPPQQTDSPEKQASRQDNERGAMVQTLRIEAIATEREKRRSINPEWSAKKIEESLNTDRDAIWRAALLPGFTDADVDVPALFNRMGMALAPRLPEIISRQQVLQAALDAPTLAHILVFQILALNTDWNVFHARALLSPSGGSDDNVKNVKLLRDGSGRLVPVPYDFDLADVYSATVNTANEYKTRLTAVLGNLGENTVPTRAQFITALRAATAAEDVLTAAATSSHLALDDKDRLVAAIHTFATTAEALIP